MWMELCSPVFSSSTTLGESRFVNLREVITYLAGASALVNL